jgi:hypothetical protein
MRFTVRRLMIGVPVMSILLGEMIALARMSYLARAWPVRAVTGGTFAAA